MSGLKFWKYAAGLGGNGRGVSVRILEPANRATLPEDTSVTFTATAEDADGVNIATSLVWTSDKDNQIGTGATFDFTPTNDEHLIIATATDSEGRTGSARINIRLAVNAAPVVTITSPIDLSVIENDVVTFTGSVWDDWDRNITSQLSWDSDLDNQIGTGGTFTRDNLSVGINTVTASVTDSDGGKGTAQVVLTVAAHQAPTVTITDPAGATIIQPGETLNLAATATDEYNNPLNDLIQWTANGILFATGASAIFSSDDLDNYEIKASATDDLQQTGEDTVAVSVSLADFFVDPAAGGTNSGTYDNPWLSWTDMTDALSAGSIAGGDTIGIKSGTVFTGAQSLPSYDTQSPAPVNIVPYDGTDRIVIDANGGAHGISFLMSANIKDSYNLYGFEIFDAVGNGLNSPGFPFGAPHNCYIHDNDGHGVYSKFTQHDVVDSIIEDNGGDGIFLEAVSSGGVVVQGIHNNVIQNNDHGIRTTDVTSPVSAPADLSITNNTLVGNTFNGWYDLATDTLPVVSRALKTFTGNLVALNGDDQVRLECNDRNVVFTNTHDNNWFFSRDKFAYRDIWVGNTDNEFPIDQMSNLAEPAHQGYEANSIEANPVFADEATGDYRLLSTSPAAGYGSSLTGTAPAVSVGSVYVNGDSWIDYNNAAQMANFYVNTTSIVDNSFTGKRLDDYDTGSVGIATEVAAYLDSRPSFGKIFLNAGGNDFTTKVDEYDLTSMQGAFIRLMDACLANTPDVTYLSCPPGKGTNVYFSTRGFPKYSEYWTLKQTARPSIDADRDAFINWTESTCAQMGVKFIQLDNLMATPSAIPLDQGLTLFEATVQPTHKPYWDRYSTAQSTDPLHRNAYGANIMMEAVSKQLRLPARPPVTEEYRWNFGYTSLPNEGSFASTGLPVVNGERYKFEVTVIITTVANQYVIGGKNNVDSLLYAHGTNRMTYTSRNGSKAALTVTGFTIADGEPHTFTIEGGGAAAAGITVTAVESAESATGTVGTDVQTDGVWVIGARTEVNTASTGFSDYAYDVKFWPNEAVNAFTNPPDHVWAFDNVDKEAGLTVRDQGSGTNTPITINNSLSKGAWVDIS